MTLAELATEDVSCTGCGAHDDIVLFEGHEHEYPNTTHARFPVVRCRECDLIRLNPRPAVSELDRIYPPEYYAYHLPFYRKLRSFALAAVPVCGEEAGG